ncbi:MAG: SpoIIE family protein phosphatase [Bacteroidales bacterium]|nr:SpoIIE family protein phosphatase [Bacteroidales bacterium]
MKIISKILTLLLIFLNTIEIQAQSSMRIYSLDESDGLCSNIINVVEEDGYGFIWVGTSSGLSKYDGQKFYKFIDKSDSVSLKGSNILDLKSDRDGNIWISTEVGVSEYDIKSEIFTYYYVETGEGCISNYQADKLIYLNKSDELLAFSSSGVLYKFNNEDKVFNRVANKFFNKYSIINCFSDIDETLWCVLNDSRTIYQINLSGEILNKYECESVNTAPLLSTTSFLNNQDGTYWLGSSVGIFEINVQNETFSEITNLGKNKLPTQIKSFYQRANGDIWIGTNAEELHIVNRNLKTVEIIESNKNNVSSRQLNSLTINSIKEDHNGLLWLSTWRGLSYVDLNPSVSFGAINYPENSEILPQNLISSLAIAPDGTLVLGTDGSGIVFWDGVSSKRKGIYSKNTITNTQMTNSSILTLVYDKEGNIWNGGYHHPLNKISKDLTSDESFSYQKIKKGGTATDFVVDILIDKKDRLWVLTNGSGLFQFDPKTQKYTHIEKDSRDISPCCESGTCLCEGYNGEILVGTYQGMYVYFPDENIIENYMYSRDIEYSISHNWINDIYRDSHQKIWVATPAGLNKFEVSTGKFSKYGEANGFTNLVCTNIIADNTNVLWITTDNGIVKYNSESNVVVRTYGIDDGVLSTNFEKNSSMMDKNGVIYFGSNDGLVYFHPNNIKTIISNPKPIITNLLIRFQNIYPYSEKSPLKQSISCTDKIDILYEDATFSLQFASLDYINAKNNKFLYKLEGYDKQWNDIGSRNEVGFTNLSPGKYKFRLVSENTDRIRSEERILEINILPPWYKTKTFIIVLILFSILFFLGLHRLRVKKLRQESQELEKKVLQRTSELLDLNSVLESRNEEMKQQSEEIQAQRDELFEKNNQLLQSRQAIQKSYENLQVLSSLGKQISSSFDVDAMANKIYKNKVVELDNCGFGICKRSKKFEMVEYSPYYEKTSITKIPEEEIKDIQDILTVQCIKKRQEIIVDDSSGQPIPPELQAKGIKTCVRLPLFNGNYVCGVMIINSFDSNAFTKNDIASLKVIASYSEAVIEKSDAYSILKSKNIAINGSINYAQTIQHALLAQKEDFEQYFDTLVIYKPKDIVSGDFLWQYVVEDKKMLFASVIDCTGHGVPGAFMSLIANTVLNEIVGTSQIYNPSEILSELSSRISRLLKQDTSDNKDGMDMSLCRFDVDQNGFINKLIFSGAKNSVFYKSINMPKYQMLVADRISIAGGVRRAGLKYTLQFTQTEININPGDIIYLFSDGVIDQNNFDRKRFGRQRFELLLNEISSYSLDNQKTEIERSISEFSQEGEQRDDISILALKIRNKAIDFTNNYSHENE